MNSFSIKVCLLALVILSFQSCVKQKSNDQSVKESFAYSEDQLLGNWAVAGDDQTSNGLVQVELMANESAKALVKEASGTQEVNASWDYNGEMTTGPLTTRYDLKIEYQNSDNEARVYLGTVTEENGKLVFLCTKVKLYKEQQAMASVVW